MNLYATQNLPQLISRKIWGAEKCWHCHNVFYYVLNHRFFFLKKSRNLYEKWVGRCFFNKNRFRFPKNDKFCHLISITHLSNLIIWFFFLQIGTRYTLNLKRMSSKKKYESPYKKNQFSSVIWWPAPQWQVPNVQACQQTQVPDASQKISSKVTNLVFNCPKKALPDV